MRKKEFIIILSSLLLIVLSVSVAYFTTKILGTEKDISVTSADLKVTFSSGSGTINGTNIEPGWTSNENTFTVKNESNGTYNYNIVIKDLVNTFTTNGFLVYKITSTDGGYNMTDFENVPKSLTSKDKVLAYNISIDKDATHTYTVEFKYLKSDDVDQSEDMGKTLTGKIFITKGTERPTIASQILMDNPTISERTDFSVAFTTNTANTLYKATENGTDVYYFAGVDVAVAHCEYNGKIIQNYSYINRIKDKEQCQSELTLCLIGDTPYYGHSDCSGNNGTSITTTDGKWIEDIEKPINNWVKFGGFYWRIIRTNADGSIRMLYSGTSPDTTEARIGTTTFNASDDSPKYVGYMYGDSDTTLEEARTNTNDSTIKTYIDSWYENNLTSYTNYLSNDAIYCNDRELASGNSYSISDHFNFKITDRLDFETIEAGGVGNASPTYNCTNNKDAFSVNNTEAKLKYPIGLMTADEAVYAGGAAGWEAPMWYYTNGVYNSITGLNYWWLSTSWQWVDWPDVFGIISSGFPGYLLNLNVSDSYAVRPVTSLKSCVQWKSGDGSASNPYEIVENGGC